MGKLVYGVGVNDADYTVLKLEVVGYRKDGSRIRKVVWRCPFYCTWKHMLERCYGEKYQLKNPTYLGCSVVPEWHYFMTFRAWMEKQDWEGNELDKDILSPNNRLYSPQTCVFVSKWVNTFLVENDSSRGEWPIGVSFHKGSGKFQAQCRNVITGKGEYLGIFANPEEAHRAWLLCKLEQAKILSAQQSDERVAKALIERYTNYK